jgi:hypothetical protein
MIYFARANAPYLEPGPWKEVTESQYETLKQLAKSRSFNFKRNGIEGLTIHEMNDASIYKNLYPELYDLLIEVKARRKSVSEAQ